MKRISSILNAPPAVGPYSIYTETGGFIFISGQIGLDPVTATLADGVVAQTTQLLQNTETILASRQLTWNNVCKTTIFLTDMNFFQAVNQIYERKFADCKPARSTVAVAALPLNALVEIEFIVAAS